MEEKKDEEIEETVGKQKENASPDTTQSREKLEKHEIATVNAIKESQFSPSAPPAAFSCPLPRPPLLFLLPPSLAYAHAPPRENRLSITIDGNLSTSTPTPRKTEDKRRKNYRGGGGGGPQPQRKTNTQHHQRQLLFFLRS